MLELENDTGWDSELVLGGKSGKYKLLDEALSSKGLLAFYNGNTYVYLTNSNVWATFVSSEAQVQICSIVGSDNVSVNYLPAAEPFINYLKRRADRVSAIPVSICVGTRRRLISLEEDTMHFKDCEPLVGVMAGLDSRISSFCDMPCYFENLPTVWRNSGPERLEKYIRPIFSDPRDLETLKWIVGDIALDPSSHSRFVMLYGQGGTGKSQLIRMLESVFEGCCSTIPSTTFTNFTSEIHLKTAQLIASNRLVTAGELDLKKKKLNLHTVKELTGHDRISVPPVSVTTRCTVVAATNYLPNPTTDTEWASTQIARRAVVLPFNVNVAQIPKVQMPTSEVDMLEFLMSSLYVRLSNNVMPVTPRTVLYTLLADHYNTISHKIEEVEEMITQEILDVNSYLNVELSLTSTTIGHLAELVSSDCTVSIEGVPYLKGVRKLNDE